MKSTLPALAVLLTHLAVSAAFGSPVTSLAELQRLIISPNHCTNEFCVEGTIIDSSQYATDQTNSLRIACFIVADESGGVRFRDIRIRAEDLHERGSRVRVEGCLTSFPTRKNHTRVRKITLLGHGDCPPVLSATGEDIRHGKFLNRETTVEGTVIDILRDEIDPKFSFIILDADSAPVYVAINDLGETATNNLVGAVVRFTGISILTECENARTGTHIEMTPTGPNAIEVLKTPPEDPFCVPDIDTLGRDTDLAQAQSMRRMKVSGQVVARWKGNRLLVKQSSGNISKVSLATAEAPSYGQFVEAVGYPETDLFSINLSRAIWRATPGSNVGEPDAEPVSATQLLTDGHGNRMVKATYNGRRIRLTGEVRGIYKVERNGIKVDLACEGQQIGTYLGYADAAPTDLEVGSVIEATGTCVMETETWRPQTPFPRIEDVALSVHSPADIRVLSRPPWWTPARMAAAAGVLLAALVGILIWNLALRRTSERKGRQLFRAQIEKVKANLKTNERTRLAVELHDSIAQNLTGVAMEIETAKRLAPSAATGMMEHLDRGSRTLRSCRDELRNCLWDLRCQALEARDMNDAIRSTLQPHADKAQISVRFNVPRALLPDNDAHAILRIVRELVINAIRHGEASAVQIAGEMDKESLMFSVRDNGKGFDPKSAPGILLGHFGLQGIEERVRQLGGTFTLSSDPGKGTRGKVVIPRNRIVENVRQEPLR